MRIPALVQFRDRSAGTHNCHSAFPGAESLLGAALGCTVMLAALATVIIHGEYGHAAPPLVAAALSFVVGWITWRKRRTVSA